MATGEAMNELLSFLIANLSFLYEKFGARFVDSQIRGSDALIVLETGPLRIRLVRDRGQIFMDFQRKENDDWYSYDIIKHLLTETPEDSAEMDKTKSSFLYQNFSQLMELFSDEEWQNAKTKLCELELARAKRLFGE